MKEIKSVKVTALMVEEGSGGFTSGISCEGIYTKKEWDEEKYYELTDDIELMEGYYWVYSDEFILK